MERNDKEKYILHWKKKRMCTSQLFSFDVFFLYATFIRYKTDLEEKEKFSSRFSWRKSSNFFLPFHGYASYPLRMKINWFHSLHCSSFILYLFSSSLSRFFVISLLLLYHVIVLACAEVPTAADWKTREALNGLSWFTSGTRMHMYIRVCSSNQGRNLHRIFGLAM